jgi:thioredoxin reductase
MTDLRTDLLIIGAGPYGLAAAAYAQESGVSSLLIGEPMSFWRDHMPAGMLLRSPLDWQIDPFHRRTLLAFLLERQISIAEADPLPLELFQEYAAWFLESYELNPRRLWVTELRKRDGLFTAVCDNGDQIEAESVLLVSGFAPFAYIPEELRRLVPDNTYSHTCDTIDLDRFRDRRCLIIGGRQSAYEWAALMAEQGATEVHISHRHPQPRFEAADWSWVGAMIDATASQRGWWRGLAAEEREAIRQHFWQEGRLKLEPWLAPRLTSDVVVCHPSTVLSACVEQPSGVLEARMDSGETLTVDHVLFATGYMVNIAAMPLLADPSIGPHIHQADGFPLLDENFQSSVDGLFLAGLPATRDFGPFFGFVSGAPLAARMIVEQVKASNL